MALVLTAVADGVGTLTLNHPDERNTLTAPMVVEIVAAMDAFEAEESVGAVVVTGTPPAFCAGANLGNLAEADGSSLGNVYEGRFGGENAVGGPKIKAITITSHRLDKRPPQYLIRIMRSILARYAPVGRP